MAITYACISTLITQSVSISPFCALRDDSPEAVVQSFPGDVLVIEDKAVIVQVYALVTSVSPLRVYRHNDGHVLLTATEQGKPVRLLLDLVLSNFTCATFSVNSFENEFDNLKQNKPDLGINF